MNPGPKKLMKIPFQDLKTTNAPRMEQLVRSAEAVLRSGRYINGPRLEEFEGRMEHLFQADFCIGVSTGLDALRLILTACKTLGRLHDGDEVIVPANTFIATFLAVTGCGLTAVAADVVEATFCLDYDRLPVTPRTKAVIPVHLYGRVCLDAASARRLKEKGLIIIEDCAQAIGARAENPVLNRSVMAGGLADAAAISFYPAKNIGAFGDAGAVLTDDPELAAAVRRLANYGSDEKYIHKLCGFNCRLDELQAALLLVKLDDTISESVRRRERARLYNSLISDGELTLPAIPDYEESHVWHQYVVRHPQRDLLRRYLADNGIGTEIHYPVPCHLQPCYRNHPQLKIYEQPVVAERLAGEILSLPIANVSDEDIRFIADTINKRL